MAKTVKIKISDTVILSDVLDLRVGSDISAIWARFQSIVLSDELKVCHIPTSGLFDLLTGKCHTFSLYGDSFYTTLCSTHALSWGGLV